MIRQKKNIIFKSIAFVGAVTLAFFGGYYVVGNNPSTQPERLGLLLAFTGFVCFFIFFVPYYIWFIKTEKKQQKLIHKEVEKFLTFIEENRKEVFCFSIDYIEVGRYKNIKKSKQFKLIEGKPIKEDTLDFLKLSIKVDFFVNEIKEISEEEYYNKQIKTAQAHKQKQKT